MKLIHKLAEQHRSKTNDWCVEHADSCVDEAFEAGFRKAIELMAEKYGDKADYLFKSDILRFGEQVT